MLGSIMQILLFHSATGGWRHSNRAVVVAGQSRAKPRKARVLAEFIVRWPPSEYAAAPPSGVGGSFDIVADEPSGLENPRREPFDLAKILPLPAQATGHVPVPDKARVDSVGHWNTS